MAFRFLTTNDTSEWHSALTRLGVSDINFLPEYHRLYELNGDGVAYAFMYEEQGNLLLYPFFLRDIECIAGVRLGGGWRDIETIHGQSGIISNSASADFLNTAWSTYFRWCDEQRVVAEFTSFNLYMDNHRYAHHSWKIIEHGEAVVLSLSHSQKELWDRYPSVQRNMIRKSQRGCLRCIEMDLVQDMEKFLPLYFRTMRRNNAGPYAYYSPKYFQALSKDLPDKIKMWGVMDDHNLIAASIFLMDGVNIYYHLSGSDEEKRSYAPNNLLLHTVAEWGVENNYKSLFLGGGGGNIGIAKFKASLSNERLKQVIGRRIHNNDKYEELCCIWLAIKCETVLPQYTFPYRLPIS